QSARPRDRRSWPCPFPRLRSSPRCPLGPRGERRSAPGPSPKQRPSARGYPTSSRTAYHHFYNRLSAGLSLAEAAPAFDRPPVAVALLGTIPVARRQIARVPEVLLRERSQLFSGLSPDLRDAVRERVDEPLDAVLARVVLPPAQPEARVGVEVLPGDLHERVVGGCDDAVVVVAQRLN